MLHGFEVRVFPALIKYNWMFPWDQTANGFQLLKSHTQFPEEPFFIAKLCEHH